MGKALESLQASKELREDLVLLLIDIIEFDYGELTSTAVTYRESCMDLLLPHANDLPRRTSILGVFYHDWRTLGSITILMPPELAGDPVATESFKKDRMVQVLNDGVKCLIPHGMRTYNKSK